MYYTADHIVYKHDYFQTRIYMIFLGDPARDLEYENEYYSNQKRRTDFMIIPEPIRNFLTYFQKVVKEQNIFEIQNAYENGCVALFEHSYSSASA